MLQSPPDIDLSSPITIGGVELRNRSFLAPMSGVTDAVFRNLAWKFGAGLVVSEMVASQALAEDDEKMHRKMCAADIPVHMVQLVGRETRWMAHAAKLAEGSGAHIIDINMGCPAKRVTTGYSGSALMRNLDHALELIEAVVKVVKVPVTLKMRLGWDDASFTAPELARRAEDAGVQMITVHGRTRCQFYKGHADWGQVSLVREAITLPMIVNGDIIDAITAQKALQVSRADAVMVGRGAYGAPWLPGFLAMNANDTMTFKVNILEVALEHYTGMLSLYGREGAIRPARKHLSWYLDHLEAFDENARLRRQILTSWNPDEVLKLLEQIFGSVPSLTLANPVSAAAA